jgi:GST-like protein
MSGQMGHFNVYAPEKIPYAIERYDNEVRRLHGVMDKRLAQHAFLAGDEYTIADMASYPWIGAYDKLPVDFAVPEPQALARSHCRARPPSGPMPCASR